MILNLPIKPISSYRWDTTGVIQEILNVFTKSKQRKYHWLRSLLKSG